MSKCLFNFFFYGRPKRMFIYIKKNKRCCIVYLKKTAAQEKSNYSSFYFKSVCHNNIRGASYAHASKYCLMCWKTPQCKMCH